MFFRYLFKHLQRSALTSALFCLLLALSGTLLCVSAGLWYSAYAGLRDIDKNITTIAIPDAFSIRRYTETHPQAHDITGEEMGEEILRTIRGTVYGSGLLELDDRRVFGAYSPGLTSVPFRATGIGHSAAVAGASPQAAAAFILTCLQVTDEYQLGWEELPGEPPLPYVSRSVRAVFTVEQTLFLHSAYPPPQNIVIYFWIQNPDGSPPVATGKRYAASGMYSPSGGIMASTVNTLSVDWLTTDTRPLETGTIHSEQEISQLLSSNLWWSDYLRSYRGPREIYPMKIMANVFDLPPDSGEPGYACFELAGTLEDALDSGQGERIQNALRVADISHNSLQVLTTHNPASLPRFNQNRRFMAEGRVFSEQEARDGARVCLISGWLAEQNGLSVGDTLPLRLYPLSLSPMSTWASVSDDSPEVLRSFWIPGRYRPELEITEPLEYTIAGIYNTLLLESGDYFIAPNTVIIPSASFGDAGDPAMSGPDLPPLLADAVIIPNGQIGETKALIDSIAEGYGGFFRFYDQGYGTVKAALLNLRLGMVWIFALAAAGWAAAVLFFALFFAARKRRETALLHALGVSRKRRFGWVFVQCAVLILVAQGVTLGAALPLYGGVFDAAVRTAESFTESFRDTTLSDAEEAGVRGRMPIRKEPLALVFAAAGGTAVLLAAAGAVSARSSGFESLSEERNVVA
ncbi:MAG: hypothetical protein FWG93_03340 [Oscillospiraceae bacterium]|nr:hypothetical protein [Oscillospiraceae bacterium]